MRCQLRGHEATVAWWSESRRHAGGDREQSHPRGHGEASRAAANPSGPSLRRQLRASRLTVEEIRSRQGQRSSQLAQATLGTGDGTKLLSRSRLAPATLLACYSQHPRILHLKTASCLTSSLGQRAQESSFMDEWART